ncbi:sigma-70 family RNA polymerase sigma factor [Streptomyces sp. NPDC018019]|uniref:sigma-70 family RNA polymerase sigma factor n=1 Tax=Streptomyces sp. NPDC018019 TaxID=3365030 RepID=UPI0037AD15A2
MDAREGLAERFEGQRDRLRAVAHRMLGSPEEADDAVQEAWLRLSRVDADAVDNLDGWLRTVVTRICLDVLRTRTSRREDLAELPAFDEVPASVAPDGPEGPEDTALLTDSVSRALLVVLDRLGPAERVVLVLHDMYAVPFHEIAPLVERTPVATKKLASRARHKVRGTPVVPAADLARHRRVISAFLTAVRAGDLPAVLALLDPDVVRRADPTALPPGVAPELRGARAVAEGTLLFAHRSRQAEPALVNGTVGLLVAPHGRLRYALTFTIENDLITGYEVFAAPARLRRLDIGVLD